MGVDLVRADWKRKLLVLEVCYWELTYERKVDLPTSASPSRSTLISGGGPSDMVCVQEVVDSMVF